MKWLFVVLIKKTYTDVNLFRGVLLDECVNGFLLWRLIKSYRVISFWPSFRLTKITLISRLNLLKKCMINIYMIRVNKCIIYGFVCSVLIRAGCEKRSKFILTWHRGHRDHEGGSPRRRLAIALRLRSPLRISPT